MLLWTQPQNCLEQMKKARENKVTTTELVRRRKILEQQKYHLMLMKRRSKLEPVVKEQREVKYKEVEHLCKEVTKLGGYLPLDFSRYEVIFPNEMTLITKETSLMITLRDVIDVIVYDSGSLFFIYLIALWCNLHQRSIDNRYQQPFCFKILFLLINKIIFTFLFFFVY